MSKHPGFLLQGRAADVTAQQCRMTERLIHQPTVPKICVIIRCCHTERITLQTRTHTHTQTRVLSNSTCSYGGGGGGDYYVSRVSFRVQRLEPSPLLPGP